MGQGWTVAAAEPPGGGVGGSVKASGGTEMDRLEVIGTRWGRWGRCSAVGGGAQDGSWRLWTWKPCR